jgi:hypothetical protein
VVTFAGAARAVPAPGAQSFESGEVGVGRARLRSRFRPNTTVRVGETVPIAVDVTQAHVFDPITGRALWHPEP